MAGISNKEWERNMKKSGFSSSDIKREKEERREINRGMKEYEKEEKKYRNLL